MIKTAIGHRIAAAIVGFRTDSTAQSAQTDLTCRLAAPSAVATATEAVYGRSMTPSSAIKHNNFCAFFVFNSLLIWRCFLL